MKITNFSFLIFFLLAVQCVCEEDLNGAIKSSIQKTDISDNSQSSPDGKPVPLKQPKNPSYKPQSLPQKTQNKTSIVPYDYTELPPYDYAELNVNQLKNLSIYITKEKLEKESLIVSLETKILDSQLDTKLHSEERFGELRALEDLLARAIKLYQNVVDAFNYNEELNFFQMSVLNLKVLSNEKEKDEQKLKKNNETNSNESSFISELGRLVADSVDELESQQQKQNNAAMNQGSKKAIMDTVVRVDDVNDLLESDEESKNSTGLFSSSKTGEKKGSVLIDSDNNQYVMSRPSDITSNHDDPRFMHDLIILLISCFLCSYFFSFLKLPTFFGHILAGILLGTTGILRNLIQVETLARGMGVIFIMFFLGLEFSYKKIQKVWSISLIGSAILLSLTILIFSCIAFAMNISVKEAYVVSSAVFLSSTAIVAKSVASPQESESVVGRAMIGICLAQDVMLGVMLAILPVLENSGIGILYAVIRLLGSLALFLLLSAILGYFPIRYLLNHLKSCDNQELFLLGSVGICLIFIQIASYLGLGMELSCFIAGVVISSQPRKSHGEKTLQTIEPLRDLFAALFFASIGMHVYPSFIIHEGYLVVLLAILLMFFKYILCLLVMTILFRYDWNSASRISIGLSQISEFTFVIASRAK
ncbi:Transmembrane and coiled-coil domains-containing protein 3, partial [Nowakowskiella sp. JEL0078]